MPWNGSSFAAKHNHRLSGAKAGHVASIANATLRRGLPEGEAIAIANKWAAHHRDDGGSVPQQDPFSVGGIAPSAENANPMVRSMIQRYATMPTEKLNELSVRLGGTPQGQMIQRLLTQRRVQPQGDPATAQPAPQLRKGGAIRRDAGGMMPMSQATPWWTRREAADETSGLLQGATPGRADAVKTQAPANAYVIPADVVSGLGEGNTLAGARIMQAIINSGPHGIPQARISHGAGPAHPPSMSRETMQNLKAGGPVPLFHAKKRRWGGVASGSTPVDLSHGEYVVSPKDVLRWGMGDHTRGHRLLDAWVVSKRKEHIAKLKKLPGPVKT